MPFVGDDQVAARIASFGGSWSARTASTAALSATLSAMTRR